ncbi:MAG: type IV secretory system conjugative DNA transfer family protein [Novosphingobium sp.]|nr:type IV secretory system conjugative DNA transfer family protein [Novosphingobium sp.]
MNLRAPFEMGTVAGGTTDMRLPESLPGQGLLVGWSLEVERHRRPIGFDFGEPDKTPATGWLDPVLLDGEGHLITIAPTGSGKGRSCIIPALLRHDGPVIIIDPKGENAAVTGRRRREMGQQLVVLDPMGLTGSETGSLNPLDLIDPEAADAVDLAAMFANAMIDGSEDPRNTYWYQRAQQLLIGLILHATTNTDPAKRTFSEIRHMLSRLVAEQTPQGQAGGASSRRAMPMRNEILRSPHPEARLAASILQSTSDQGLGSILSMTQDGVDFLRGPLVDKATSTTSFDLAAVTRGDPLSIYLVLPPHMLESHGRLLRLWVMALLSLITRRRSKPERSTLLILDEAAQLGSLPQLRQAITLLRGYGVQAWSFWQDVSQLRRLYPADWETMVNNCAVVQAFGALNLMASRSMAQLTGFGGDDGRAVLDLEDHEMLLQIAGDEAIVARKPDYLTDPAFREQFDANPYHDPHRPVMPPPPPRIQLDVSDATSQTSGELRAAEGMDNPVARLIDRNRARRRIDEMDEPGWQERADRLRERLLAKWSDPSGKDGQ